MARYDPYATRMTRGRGARSPKGNFSPRGRRTVSRGFSQRGERTQQSLDFLNTAPPKIIRTVKLDRNQSKSLSVSETESRPSTKKNFCVSWLAKNRHLAKTVVAEILVDDSKMEDSINSDCQITSSFRHQCGAEGPSSQKDDEDSVIYIETVPRKMTQVETKVTTEKFWTIPASSSATQTTKSVIVTEIKDGFSKDCTDFKRKSRCWNQVLFDTKSTTTLSTTITVCSYNVLCQKTIARTDYLYKHLKDPSTLKFLDWEHRWKGLQSELPTFNADIVGLQEVQCDHFEDHFLPLMEKNGYEGIYKQKVGGSELKDDGCALFYRPEKFERLGYQEVNYFISPRATSNRENIAQILALRCRKTGEVLLIANTHLLFNEERGDVKIAQLAILFAYIDNMKTDLAVFHPSVILMGDFNMEYNSKVYEFIVNGKLHIEGMPVRTMSGQSLRDGGKLCKAKELLQETSVGMNSRFLIANTQRPLSDGCIRHPFNFLSAYHQGPPETRRSISTYHKDMASPDFIFFTSETAPTGVEKLRLLERFALPTIDTLKRAVPWPNENVPSDHLPIIAKFRLTRTTI